MSSFVNEMKDLYAASDERKQPCNGFGEDLCHQLQPHPCNATGQGESLSLLHLLMDRKADLRVGYPNEAIPQRSTDGIEPHRIEVHLVMKESYIGPH